MEENVNGTQNVGTNGDGAMAPQTQQAQNVPQEVTVQPAATGAPATKEPGFFKKHWKKIVAGAAAVATAAGSAFVAYKKGKAAGAVMYPPQPQDDEDYSLNPNV